jgi:hypothetical protein
MRNTVLIEPSMTRRAVVIGGCAIAAWMLGGRGAHAAGSLCAMTRMNTAAAPGLYEASPAARKDLDDVMAALQLTVNIPIYASEQVANAAAYPNLSGGPAIVYNPDFMTRLYEINDWAPASVVAHEFGHHVAQQRAHPNSHTRELAADEVSGCAMAWMGATEAQATIAMIKGLPVTAGSSTHPGTAQRVAAIEAAYRECLALRDEASTT